MWFNLSHHHFAGCFPELLVQLVPHFTA